MWIRRPAVMSVAAGLFAVGFLAPKAALAQTAELKECATQYQAAKADSKFSQAWQDFFAECKAKLAASAPKAEAPEAAAPEAAAPAPKAESEKAEAPKEEAQPAHAAAGAEDHAMAAKEEKPTAEAREKKCRAEWKAQGAELKKKDPKLTSAKYLKQCAARHTGASE